MDSSRLSAAGVLAMSIATLLTASDFEAPPKLAASDFLQAGAIAGERHKVDEAVANDGYMNSYGITSDFGHFEAYGTVELFVRLREIGALGALDELTKTEVFSNAVVEGATASVKALETIAKNPVETAKGIPEGVGKLFGRTKRSVKKGVDAGKDLKDKHSGKDAEDEPSGLYTFSRIFRGSRMTTRPSLRRTAMPREASLYSPGPSPSPPRVRT